MSELFKICRIAKSADVYAITVNIGIEPLVTYYSTVKPQSSYNTATHEYIVQNQNFIAVVDRVEDES